MIIKDLYKIIAVSTPSDEIPSVQEQERQARTKIREEFNLPNIAENPKTDPIKTLKLLEEAKSFLIENDLYEDRNAIIELQFTPRHFKIPGKTLAEIMTMESKEFQELPYHQKRSKAIAGLILMGRKVVPEYKRSASSIVSTACLFLRAIEELWDTGCLRLDQNEIPALTYIPKQPEQEIQNELEITNQEIKIGYRIYQILSKRELTDADFKKALEFFEELDKLRPNNSMYSNEHTITFAIKEQLIKKALSREHDQLAFNLSVQAITKIRSDSLPSTSLARLFIRQQRFNAADLLLRHADIPQSTEAYQELMALELEKVKQGYVDPEFTFWSVVATYWKHGYNSLLQIFVCNLIRIGKTEDAKRHHGLLDQQFYVSTEHPHQSSQSYNLNTSDIIVEWINSDHYCEAQDRLAQLVNKNPDYNQALVNPIVAFLQKGQTELANHYLEKLTDPKEKIALAWQCVKNNLDEFAKKVSATIDPGSKHYNECQLRMVIAYIVLSKYKDAWNLYSQITWNKNDDNYLASAPVVRLTSKGQDDLAIQFFKHLPLSAFWPLCFQIEKTPNKILMLSLEIPNEDITLLEKLAEWLRKNEHISQADEIENRLNRLKSDKLAKLYKQKRKKAKAVLEAIQTRKRDVQNRSHKTKPS